jgi:hypothetical protein
MRFCNNMAFGGFFGGVCLPTSKKNNNFKVIRVQSRAPSEE